MSDWIDLTHPVHPAMPVWEGAPAPIIEPVVEIGPDSSCRVSRVVLDVHLGTHLDAPGHFLPDGKMVESLSLEDLVGPCWIADTGPASVVTASVLEHAGIPLDCRRLLLRTENTRRDLMRQREFVRDFVALDLSGARWLLSRGLRLVGFDYLSVQGFHESDDVHRELLGAGMVLVEGLDLSSVDCGLHDLVCLPPKWVGSDGAPARVIVRPI
ncbi:MAG: cyclase family protein [Fibrobacteria bacterium]|nr:cyclase family protein [Fibrobacteria bacterium]